MKKTSSKDQNVVIYYSCNTTTKKDIILEGKEDVTNETL